MPASILKPMLARGEIQLIGATTPEEYRKTIQKDSALDRRFGMVNIEEPAPQQAEKILTGLMPRYERYHGVRIPQEAIRAAVELSVRYLPGRYLPDKAIDLLDEAAAALRISGGEQSMLPGSKMPGADLGGNCQGGGQGQRRARRAGRGGGACAPGPAGSPPCRAGDWSAAARCMPWRRLSGAAAPACGKLAAPLAQCCF